MCDAALKLPGCLWCVQAYSKPPPLVDITLSGVMTVLRRPGSWEEAKKALGDANFMSKLLNFDKVCGAVRRCVAAAGHHTALRPALSACLG